MELNVSLFLTIIWFIRAQDIGKNNKCIKIAFKKTAEEKTAKLITAIGPENLKTAEEITATFWPNRRN